MGAAFRILLLRAFIIENSSKRFVHAKDLRIPVLSKTVMLGMSRERIRIYTSAICFRVPPHNSYPDYLSR